MVFCNRLRIHHPSHDCPPTFVHTIDHTFGGHKVLRPILLIIHLSPYVWFVYLYPVAGQSLWSALCHCCRRSTNCYWFLRSVRGKAFTPSASPHLFSRHPGTGRYPCSYWNLHRLISAAYYHYRASECPSSIILAYHNMWTGLVENQYSELVSCR
jgi:hypothetical protein